MFRPSTRARYAVRALIELALREGTGPVSLRVVARAQRVPPKYLEQLAIALRRANLLRAARGPGGGYELARPAAEIVALEIVQAVEASQFTVDGSPEAGDRSEPYAARQLWSRVGRAAHEVLSGTTLAHLRDEQRAAVEGAVPGYQI